MTPADGWVATYIRGVELDVIGFDVTDLGTYFAIVADHDGILRRADHIDGYTGLHRSGGIVAVIPGGGLQFKGRQDADWYPVDHWAIRGDGRHAVVFLSPDGPEVFDDAGFEYRRSPGRTRAA